jgi:hypothetical protein
VDVNVGDPIWPRPVEISMPRLLVDKPIRLRGYPIEMVLAEKIVTALQRGVASTRWRDFADAYLLTGRYPYRAGDVRQATHAVADHRRVALGSLADALDGYAEFGQRNWVAWCGKFQLTDVLPAAFADTLDALCAFADPVLTDALVGAATWEPTSRMWLD